VNEGPEGSVWPPLGWFHGPVNHARDGYSVDYLTGDRLGDGVVVRAYGLEMEFHPDRDDERCGERVEEISVSCCLPKGHDMPHLGETDEDVARRGPRVAVRMGMA